MATNKKDGVLPLVQSRSTTKHRENQLWSRIMSKKKYVVGYPFVEVIMDEQRPESLGADARDLCEIIHIRGKSEKRLTMPLVQSRSTTKHRKNSIMD